MSLNFHAESPQRLAAPAARDSDSFKDPLSFLLDAAHVTGGNLLHAQVPESFAVDFPQGTRCLHLIQAGPVELRIPQTGQVFDLQSGDAVLLPHGTPHALRGPQASAATAPLDNPFGKNGQLAMQVGSDGATRWLTGTFRLEPMLASPLLRLLPPVIHVGAEQASQLYWLKQATRFLLEEADSHEAGAAAMVARLLELLLIRLLRHWAATSDQPLVLLRDGGAHRLSKALAAIHHDPTRLWTVSELAALSAMSRSTFADRFQATMGTTPASYVAQWRMHRACQMLRHTQLSIQAISDQCGYSSAAVFSRAFHRMFRTSPLHWRQRVVK